MRSRQYQSANRHSGLRYSRRLTSCKRKTGLCDSSCARLGSYSDSGAWDVRINFFYSFWQVGDAAVLCLFLSCFCFKHFVYLLIVLFFFGFFHVVKLNTVHNSLTLTRLNGSRVTCVQRCADSTVLNYRLAKHISAEKALILIRYTSVHLQ